MSWRKCGDSKSFSIEDYVNLHLNKYIVTATQPQFHIRNVTNEWNKQRCMPRSTNLINFGLYYPQVMNWLCNFPVENIMIIQSEEFYQYPSRVVTQVLHFIGLSSLLEENYIAMSSTAYNKGNYDKYGAKCLTNNSESYTTIFTGPSMQHSLNCFTGTMWTGVEYTEFLVSNLNWLLLQLHPFSFCYHIMNEWCNKLANELI